MKPSSLLLPFVALALAGSSRAQQGPPPLVSPCLPFEPANSIDWPAIGHGSAASFGRAVVGKFSSVSPTDRDAVIVAGGVAVHARSIAAYKSLDPITFPTQAALLYVADVAVLPGAGFGGTDALLATDWRGLLRTSFRNGAFLNPVVLEGDDWIDAAPIHVVDANGAGGLDILGVSADRMRVLVLIANGSSYVESAITMPDPILDVVASDWDGDGTRELLVLTMAGLSAYSLTGSEELSVPYAASSGAIAGVTWPLSTGAFVERIAWGRPLAGGGGELVVLAREPLGPINTDSTLALVFDSCEPISFVPKAILAGHYTEDMHEDLLLVHEADQTAVVLVNTGAAPHFSGSDSFHDIVPLSLVPGGAGAVGLPAFEQVDGVGAEDFVFPVQASGAVELFLNMDRYRFPKATGGGAPPTSKNVFDDQSEYHSATTRQLHLALEIPLQYQSYELARVTLYKEPTAGELINEAVSHEDHSLVKVTSQGGNLTAYPTQHLHLQYQFPPALYWSPRPYYYADVRFVDVETGALSPHYFAGMTLPETEGTDPYSHLFAAGLPPLLHFIHIPESPAGGGAPDSTHIGAYIPMSSSPAFANGEPPPIPIKIGPFTAYIYENTGT